MENKKYIEEVAKKEKIKLLEEKLKKRIEELKNKKNEIYFIQVILMEEQFYEKDIYYDKQIEDYVGNDLLKKLKNNLWRNLYSRFNNNSFKISLELVKDDEIYESESQLKKFDQYNQVLKNYYILENEVCYLVEYLQHYLEKNEIDLFDSLIEHEDYDKLSEIITSPYTSLENFEPLIDKILTKCPKQLNKIFTTIPDVDYFPSNIKETQDINKLYKELVIKQLKKGLNNKTLVDQIFDGETNETIKEHMRNFIDPNRQTCNPSPKLNSRDFINIIETIFDYEIIKYSDIHFGIGGQCSSAAIAYRYNRIELGNYLYNLEINQELDIFDSFFYDIYIIDIFLGDKKHIDKNIFNFLEQKNFHTNYGIFIYLEEKLRKLKEENFQYISENELDHLISLLLKKTKEEDLEDMIKVSEEFRNNLNNMKATPSLQILGNFTNNEKAKQMILIPVKKEE